MFDYKYKASVLNENGSYILAGDDALYCAGLTRQPVDTPMCWTTYKEIANGLFAVFVRYFQNPMGNDLAYTNPSPIHENIHEPIQERAIVETIKFHEQFNEGILIEALQSYIYNRTDFTLLYEVGDYFNVSKDDIDYWLNEAREESDMSMD